MRASCQFRPGDGARIRAEQAARYADLYGDIRGHGEVERLEKRGQLYVLHVRMGERIILARPSHCRRLRPRKPRWYVKIRAPISSTVPGKKKWKWARAGTDGGFASREEAEQELRALREVHDEARDGRAEYTLFYAGSRVRL